MKTNFKEYLKKKDAQTVINKYATQYKDKKIVLYGAGLFAGDLFRNYDLSQLNIIGVADQLFKDNTDGDFYGHKKLAPEDLLETEFDLLLITTYDDTEIKAFLKKDLFLGEETNFKIRQLIKLTLFEYIKALFKGELRS